MTGTLVGGLQDGVTHPAEHLTDELGKVIGSLQDKMLHGDVDTRDMRVLTSLQHLRRRWAAHILPEERMSTGGYLT